MKYWEFPAPVVSTSHYSKQFYYITMDYIDGLVQDCSNSIANALELLQSCTKPSISMTQSKTI